MSGRRCGKLLVLTMSLLAALGVSSLTAAASPSSAAVQKSFAGDVGAHYFRCFRKPAKFCRGPRGPRGLRGLTGQTGAAGNNGAPGLTGAAGPQGSQGPAGDPAGPPGSRGPTGTTGARGPTGLSGVKGTTGLQGTRGVTGISGTNGSPGTTGSRGPTGTTGAAGSSGVSQYAYIYNVGAANVLVEADVAFDTNGFLTSGFTHSLGTAPVTVVSTGVYKVTFSVSGTEASQFALFVNGTLVPGTIYGSAAATQQNDGNASLVIEKLG